MYKYTKCIKLHNLTNKHTHMQLYKHTNIQPYVLLNALIITF